MRLPHYYICRICALSKGGAETKFPHTVHEGDCEYCGHKKVVMVPVRDFKWPIKEVKNENEPA